MTQKTVLEKRDYYFSKTEFYPEMLVDPAKQLTKRHPKPQNSWKLVDWVTKNSNLKRNAKLVSIHVAGYYSTSKGYSYPTYENLMKDTGLGYATISRAIAEMKLSGEWIIISTTNSKHSRHTNNRYYYLAPDKNDEYIDLDKYAKEEDSSFHDMLSKQIASKKSEPNTIQGKKPKLGDNPEIESTPYIVSKEEAENLFPDISSDEKRPYYPKRTSAEKLEIELSQRIWIPHTTFSNIKEYDEYLSTRIVRNQWL